VVPGLSAARGFCQPGYPLKFLAERGLRDRSVVIVEKLRMPENQIDGFPKASRGAITRGGKLKSQPAYRRGKKA